MVYTCSNESCFLLGSTKMVWIACYRRNPIAGFCYWSLVTVQMQWVSTEAAALLLAMQKCIKLLVVLWAIGQYCTFRYKGSLFLIIFLAVMMFPQLTITDNLNQSQLCPPWNEFEVYARYDFVLLYIPRGAHFICSFCETEATLNSFFKFLHITCKTHPFVKLSTRAQVICSLLIVRREPVNYKFELVHEHIDRELPHSFCHYGCFHFSRTVYNWHSILVWWRLMVRASYSRGAFLLTRSAQCTP